MCGFVGFVGNSEYAAANLLRSAELLSHRGPDGTGFALISPAYTLHRWRANSAGRPPGVAIAGLGHTRLSIIDESERSDQPMVDETGRVALVYNGEIYNFVELRRDLERLGHRFRSSGDTEVLLAGYQEWGPDVTTRLVGMWAFAITDLEKRVLFLSRDRFGIKPLYWSTGGGTLVFASEIKALQPLVAHPFEPNERAVVDFLVDGLSDHGDETFFSGVNRLPAASNAVVPIRQEVRTIEAMPYWRLRDEPTEVDSAAAADYLRDALRTSVDQHLRSDVPTASCLSGGLDSSSIVSLAARPTALERTQRPYLAFGYCSDDETVSERRYMEHVAAATGIKLQTVAPEPEHVAEAVRRMIRHHDEPVGSASVLAQWLVFEQVHDSGIKVVLDGQGADELLGGYHSYYLPRAVDLLRGGRLRELSRLLRGMSMNGGRASLAARVLVELLPPRLQRVAKGLRPRTRRPPMSLGLLTPRMRALYRDVRGSRPVGRTTFRQARSTDLLEMRLPALLRYEDVNSMAHSVEARVPFLDHRLVELVAGMPDDLLMDGAETKAVLRRAMRGLVPDEVLLRRDKIGFRASPSWTADLASDPRQWENATEQERGWFETAHLRDVLGGPVRTESDSEFLAWRLASIKMWARGHWS